MSISHVQTRLHVTFVHFPSICKSLYVFFCVFLTASSVKIHSQKLFLKMFLWVGIGNKLIHFLKITQINVLCQNFTVDYLAL